ncbi:hypothetical protein [Pseudochryseolinea flava]|uniref:SIR2-like domain-containing protein n=1 Tax=Pseudochryseolinea flava TaxID=2059302 RepID=A0A364Y6A7_9BACT|nr:hypothetical protein [Pseudochryseolinea flava]RAW02591.1 hypothetical protein DQQ10_00290 [Pseudochryseolinea flava]
MSKRTVLLFGAGAAIPWGGPTTASLTTIVRNAGKSFRDKTNVPITELVFENLKQALPEPEINFETIISVIEDLLAYYAYYNGEERLPSITNAFFKSVFGEHNWDFTIAGAKEEHGYRLNIPSNTEYAFGKISLNYENPTQFYFQHLFFNTC